MLGFLLWVKGNVGYSGVVRKAALCRAKHCPACSPEPSPGSKHVDEISLFLCIHVCKYSSFLSVLFGLCWWDKQSLDVQHLKKHVIFMLLLLFQKLNFEEVVMKTNDAVVFSPPIPSTSNTSRIPHYKHLVLMKGKTGVKDFSCQGCSLELL